ncbi:pyrimidine reductase family protein [Nonomuraea sp. MCN248]|uniref:Pyrimidine reductase family protein n=1 Tax=Nonomuraea corallina TaxID=2989783 RepID=A0ABT4SAN0_9ACTN|nr:pyrimidine reductase family protein [Nonomuraea corallina]MDA0634258.1 pyrimidine reductase family protein [Nonomuraea corallina]
MRRIHPGPEDDPDLVRAYAYPEGRPWLRLNMVVSADGAAWDQGLSGGLSGRADKRVFGVLRGLADVVLVGAATVRAEGYGPVKPRESWRVLRAGGPAAAPLAIVSRGLDLDFDAPLFREAVSPTLVITCESAPEDRRKAAAAAGEVILAGGEEVDPRRAVAGLHARGLTRVLCEGGPRLNAQFAAAGLVDELCLSVSPLLLGGDAARILDGEPSRARLELRQVLEEEGVLFCRYVREMSP